MTCEDDTSKELGSDETNSDDDGDTSTAQKVRSEINKNNIVEGKRTRTSQSLPNVDTFAGKRYNASMLNIGPDAFARFEKD